MGGRIVQPDKDFGAILADITKRLDKLERAPVNVIDQLNDNYTGLVNQGITALSTAPVAVTNSTFTVALSVPTRLLIICQMSFGVTAGTDFGYGYIVLDGVGIGRGAIAGNGATGYYSATMIAAPLVTGANHSVSTYAYVGSAGTTVQVNSVETWVFRLGST